MQRSRAQKQATRHRKAGGGCVVTVSVLPLHSSHAHTQRILYAIKLKLFVPSIAIVSRLFCTLASAAHFSQIRKALPPFSDRRELRYGETVLRNELFQLNIYDCICIQFKIHNSTLGARHQMQLFGRNLVVGVYAKGRMRYAGSHGRN